jgi:hypothetical protein
MPGSIRFKSGPGLEDPSSLAFAETRFLGRMPGHKHPKMTI